MGKSIKVSHKHGVNPTIPICFWCGEQRNEIALMGRLPKDAEAPRAAVVDYEFCDKCMENVEDGVILIQVTQSPKHGQPQIQEGIYPTGKWVAVRPEAAKEIFNNIGDHKKAFLDEEVWKQIGLD